MNHIATAPDRQLVLPEKSHQDYAAAVEEHPTLRVEYLNGDIVMTPARSPHHQIIAANLMLLLGNYVKEKGLGLVLTAPLDVVLDREAQIAQPDLIFISKPRVGKLVARATITGAPDMLIEILSPSTTRADRKVKLPLYARYGVAEYWIVDPEDRSLEIYALDGESYRVAGICLPGETVKYGRFADAQVPVDGVFAE